MTSLKEVKNNAFCPNLLTSRYAFWRKTVRSYDKSYVVFTANVVWNQNVFWDRFLRYYLIKLGQTQFCSDVILHYAIIPLPAGVRW